MEQLHLHINGEAVAVWVEGNPTLLSLLRDNLGLTGAKCGCSTGDCGACRVIFDGEAVNSCLILAKNAPGHEIITIEGLSCGDTLDPIQLAFIQAGAVQCGYCTPGMVLSAKALLDKNPAPTEGEIRQALAPNLCRCTGYTKIVDAVRLAIALRGEARI